MHLSSSSSGVKEDDETKKGRGDTDDGDGVAELLTQRVTAIRENLRKTFFRSDDDADERDRDDDKDKGSDQDSDKDSDKDMPVQPSKRPLSNG